MRRANWASLAINFATIALAVVACSSIARPTPRSMHLVRAELAVDMPGNLIETPPKTLPSLKALSWVEVELPHALERSVVPNQFETDPAKMDSVRVWYRIVVAADRLDDNIAALYLPRWHTWGNLAIYANDALIYSSLEEGIYSSFNHPLLVRLPTHLDSNHGPLELVIRMDSVRAIGGALSSIWIGPTMELRPIFESRRLLQNRVPQITSAIFLVLGVFALGIWARRRHEITQLLFFVLSVLFYVRNLHYYLEDTQFSEQWLQWVTVNSLGWMMIVVYLFAFRLHGQRYRTIEGSLTGAMVLASVLSLPVGWFEISFVSSLTYLIFIAVSWGVTLMISIASWRARSMESGALAAVLWFNNILGVHDWMLQNWRIDIESIYLLPFGVVALFGVFLTTVLRRYLGALAENERSSAFLEQRLADRERELLVSYGKLREVEHAQMLSEERQRLMREMHDGLGSALMSSLVAVERGQMQASEIAQVLRECVDDLKLTIDSLEPVGDDLLVLLATLRYRLEPRLQAAGIQLLWDVQPIPSLPWLNPSSALHILRMLQEVLTNILKHARARNIRIATEVHDERNEIIVVVSDDGAGFDVQAAHSGRGLTNLRRRANAIGGRIEFQSNATGTRIRISLLVERLPV
jgi:signal transduction histidine kinase